jgi:hypothetical protein
MHAALPQKRVVIAENGRSRKIAFVHHLEWL